LHHAVAKALHGTLAKGKRAGLVNIGHIGSPSRLIRI
jgi:hypothetical protein